MAGIEKGGGACHACSCFGLYVTGGPLCNTLFKSPAGKYSNINIGGLMLIPSNETKFGCFNKLRGRERCKYMRRNELSGCITSSSRLLPGIPQIPYQGWNPNRSSFLSRPLLSRANYLYIPCRSWYFGGGGETNLVES